MIIQVQIILIISNLTKIPFFTLIKIICMTTIESINIIKRTILKKKSYNLGEKDIPLLNLIIEEIQSKNKKNKPCKNGDEQRAPHNPEMSPAGGVHKVRKKTASL